MSYLVYRPGSLCEIILVNTTITVIRMHIATAYRPILKCLLFNESHLRFSTDCTAKNRNSTTTPR